MTTSEVLGRSEYRRIRRYLISPDNLVQIFTTGQMFECIVGIPSGAHFRGFAHDYQTNCLVMFVEHPSFDLVHESCVVPHGDNIGLRKIPQ